MSQLVYEFGGNKTDGNANMRNLLGGKGANLAEMAKLGIPVPAGFTITTDVCNDYYKNGQKLFAELKEEVKNHIKIVGNKVGKIFGDKKNPLLVSVRSGSRFSMPGMMDTILNLGLNDKTVEGIAEKTNNERFAYDSYRRFIQMYANVVLQIDMRVFEKTISDFKKRRGIIEDIEFEAEAFKEMCDEFKKIIKEKFEKDFPQEPNKQINGAIEAVFQSWMNERAITYRQINNIPESYGTAVNIQSMVFGNLNNNSAKGFAFTRNPATGEKENYGEYLINAQGEDVVAGIRTPEKIEDMEKSFPKLNQDFEEIKATLEKHYKDMQDIEFTIEDGKLYILQTRNGKRTAQAAIKIATDMVQEEKISKKEAIERIDPNSIEQLLHPRLDPKDAINPDTKGLPASPGAACGEVVFNAIDAERKLNEGKKVILVRHETSPEDIKGMHVSEGILTKTGGATSHAAVVSRGMGKPCVSGAKEIEIDAVNKTLRINGKTVKEGDIISIDGGTGMVFLKEIRTIDAEFSQEYNTIMQWADKERKMQIRTNADNPKDTKKALELGAEGIGLCRTEHMFFEGNRISQVRGMILSDNEELRQKAIKELLPMQKSDFYEIFMLMEDRPVNIRLLDPPLHEFLPNQEHDIKELSEAINMTPDRIRNRIQELKEVNPMLGTRGCRLGILYPEIYDMQIKAIFEAAFQAEAKMEKQVKLEIMVPLVMSVKEFEPIKQRIKQIANEIEQKKKKKIEYQIGTMIELPKAALIAGKLVKAGAEFFSFGTNDLTQTTLGLSRDDTGNMIQEYKKQSIIDVDPFEKLDEEGPGELIEIAIDRAREEEKNIKLGVCGEHGGDPKTIEFISKNNMNYTSCSPFRVPIARLAAAKAEIKKKK